MAVASIATLFLCFAHLVNVEAMTMQTEMKTSMGAKTGTAATATAHMAATLSHRENPVRKVVQVLTDVQARVNKEAEEDKKEYDEYICWCQEKGVKITHEIEEFKGGLDALEEELKKTKAEQNRLENLYTEDEHQYKMDEAHLKKLKTLRGEELARYLARKRELDKDIAAVREAIPAIERGLHSQLRGPTFPWTPDIDAVASFLQSPSKTTVLNLVKDTDIDVDESDRDMVISFLSSKGRPDPKYEPGAGEIIGILKQIRDELETELYNLIHDEDLSVAEYQQLVKDIRAEEHALSQKVQDYLKALANEGILMAEEQGYANDLYDSLLTDEEYLQRMTVRCNKYKDEYKERYHLRNAELKAIAETISILDGAESSELFRKVLNKPEGESFLQMQVSSKRLMLEAAMHLHGKNAPGNGRYGDPRVDLIEIAMRGGKIGFTRIISTIETLIETLKEEQEADTRKLDWCYAQFTDAEAENISNKMDISNFGRVVKTLEAELDELKEEIAKIEEELKAEKADYVRQTQMRQEQNSEYLATIGSNTAALHILDMAKNRLNKFYNPDSYHASISYSMAQQTPPESKSGGAIQMLEQIIADLEEENKLLKIEETAAQKAYEQFLENSKAASGDKANMLTDKQAELASLEEEYNKELAKLKDIYVVDHNNEEEIKSLHAQCDFLDKYHDVRKTMRNEEIENLQQAIGILSGAKDCSQEVCTQDMCPDGKPREQIGGNCCACAGGEDASSMGVCTVTDMRIAVKQMPPACQDKSDENSVASMVEAISQMDKMDTQTKQAMESKMMMVGVSQLCPCIKHVTEELAGAFKECKVMPGSPASMYAFWKACQGPKENIPKGWGFIQGGANSTSSLQEKNDEKALDAIFGKVPGKEGVALIQTQRSGRRLQKSLRGSGKL